MSITEIRRFSSSSFHFSFHSHIRLLTRHPFILSLPSRSFVAHFTCFPFIVSPFLLISLSHINNFYSLESLSIVSRARCARNQLIARQHCRQMQATGARHAVTSLHSQHPPCSSPQRILLFLSVLEFYLSKFGLILFLFDPFFFFFQFKSLFFSVACMLHST